jgi:hypothetical protein
MGFLGYEDAKNPKPQTYEQIIGDANNNAKIASSSSDIKGGKRSRKTRKGRIRKSRKSKTRRRNKK